MNGWRSLKVSIKFNLIPVLYRDVVNYANTSCVDKEKRKKLNRKLFNIHNNKAEIYVLLGKMTLVTHSSHVSSTRGQCTHPCGLYNFLFINSLLHFLGVFLRSFFDSILRVYIPKNCCLKSHSYKKCLVLKLKTPR